ncbi:hypothetical protein [Nocardioides sp. 503]|uniref:hypothetical protein n=1 Tax=Nocardioides sp. 503 TaxID=2508326 RepID=UPI001070063E|nr:hypothetical protein [Nocardioides sp. 503]
MTRHTWVRRLVTAAAVLALPLGLTVGSAVASSVARDAAHLPVHERAATQRVVLKAPGCEGCRLRVYSAVFGEDGEPDVWTSRARRVTDGRAAFSVPAGRTHGLSVSVTAPWEGQTGYVTHVAFKYRGIGAGEVVTVARARTKQRASACWAGTDARRTVLRLVTRKVTVEGVQGPTAGTLAFARVGQPAMVPLRRAHAGVLGSQDVNICGKR